MYFDLFSLFRQIKELRRTPYATAAAIGDHQDPHVPPTAHHDAHQAHHDARIPEAPQDRKGAEDSQNAADVNANGSQSSIEPCATLAEWVQNSMPSSQEFEVSFLLLW